MDLSDLYREFGLNEEELLTQQEWLDTRFLVKAISRLWRVTGDELAGFGKKGLRPGTWALICDFMLSADNLGELYRRGEKICSFIESGELAISVSVDEYYVYVSTINLTSSQVSQQYLAAIFTVLWHRFACWAVDEYIKLRKASYICVDTGHGSLYEEMLCCPIEFGQSQNSICFNKKYLSLPVKRSKAELLEWLRNSPADLLYIPGRDTSICAAITRHLHDSLDQYQYFPSFEYVCEQLRMGGQVVRRRLDEEGTSYQKIKDKVRLDKIKLLLSDPNITIAVISEKAGFAEPTALSRAFKKWTGVTPVQFRNRLVDS